MLLGVNPLHTLWEISFWGLGYVTDEVLQIKVNTHETGLYSYIGGQSEHQGYDRTRCSSSSPMCSSDVRVSLVRRSSSVPSMLLALNLSTNPWRPSPSSHADTSPSDQSLTSSMDRLAELLPGSQSEMLGPCPPPLEKWPNSPHATLSWNSAD